MDTIKDQFGLSPRPPRSTRYVARGAPRPPARQRAAGATRRTSAASSHQARRSSGQTPYVVGFVVILVSLGTFLGIGVNWATGSGREAGLGPALTPVATQPAAAPAVSTVAPAPASSPAVVSKPSGSPTAASKPGAPSATATPVGRTYTVKAGDNPSRIAGQFGITAEELMRANNISDPSSLQIDQVLRIPQGR